MLLNVTSKRKIKRKTNLKGYSIYKFQSFVVDLNIPSPINVCAHDVPERPYFVKKGLKSFFSPLFVILRSHGKLTQIIWIYTDNFSPVERRRLWPLLVYRERKVQRNPFSPFTNALSSGRCLYKLSRIKLLIVLSFENSGLRCCCRENCEKL